MFSIAGCLVLLSSKRIWKKIVQLCIAARPEKAPAHAASIWYELLVKKLARTGLKKMPEQTPQEFLAVIGNRPLRAKVEKFTLHYERARFGDSASDAQLLPALYDQIRRRRQDDSDSIEPGLEQEHETAAYK